MKGMLSPGPAGWRRRFACPTRIALAALFGASITCMAQPPAALTLAQAKEIALRNHPRIESAGLAAEAANTTVTQARAPYYPVIAANFTAVGAQQNATLSAGALTTSSLFSRVASGVAVGQLVTDFGRTGSLAAAAKLRAAALSRNVMNTRALVLLEVDQSYYQALVAKAVLVAARAAVGNLS